MKKIVALTGAALILAGCILPFFTSLPILLIGEEGKSFFSDYSDMPKIPDRNNPALILYAGIFLISIASICALLTVIGKTKFIWIGGLMGALTLIAVYFGFQMEMEKAKKHFEEMPDVMQMMAQAAFDQISLGGSGWYVIGSGILLLLISPFFKK